MPESPDPQKSRSALVVADKSRFPGASGEHSRDRPESGAPDSNDTHGRPESGPPDSNDSRDSPESGPPVGDAIRRVVASRAAGSDAQLIDLWLKGKSANTREAYRRDAGQFFEFFGGGIPYVRLDDLWAWHDELVDQGLSVASVARKLACLKSLFSFGHRIGVLPMNVGAALNLPKVPSRLSERILTEDETRLLLNDPDSPRNSALLRLFYSSGARVSELTGLTWAAIRPRMLKGGARTAQLSLLGKGSKTRSVLLSPDTWAQLADFQKMEVSEGFGKPEDAVFRSNRGGSLTRQRMWRIVRDAAGRAGLPQKVSPHWLRHAHASHALDRGAPVHLVKETLGHESLATTSKYAHARPDDSSSQYLDV